MTIQSYLQGKFDYEFSELNFQSVLAGRGIEPFSSHTEVSEKDTDLALSDLYVILANVTSGGGKRVTKGNRTVTERTYSFGITDRINFRNEADRLRLKWGEGSESSSSVKFANLYGI